MTMVPGSLQSRKRRTLETVLKETVELTGQLRRRQERTDTDVEMNTWQNAVRLTASILRHTTYQLHTTNV